MPQEPQSLFLDTLASPVGDLLLAMDGEAVCLLAFADEGDWANRYLRRQWPDHRLERRPVPGAIRAALDAYFDGDLHAIDRITACGRGTAFQQSVWDELRRIAPGRTATYSEVAERIGRPKAIRAAGLANARNPVSIIVPCHRVIGSDGSLTGYGGGLPRKAWLLSHEGVSLAHG